jgi:phosphatidylglycerol:prolipoprotein diacylglycerol transferase
MINWLHTFNPSSILFSLGPINVHWYGFFIVLGIGAALLISLKIANLYKINSDKIFDISFWLIINGLIGARLYEILLEFSYYLYSPLNIFKIWEGGLAIHGAIIGGALTILYFARKEKLSFWTLGAIFTPGLALGQAIGRWGNYFNQELFGHPTGLPWGIPINILHRPENYQEYLFFHPTFLYESFGLIVIFIILLSLSFILLKNQKNISKEPLIITATYLILTSSLRFYLEYLKIDTTPIFLGLRWPQFFSLVIILFALLSLILNYHANQKTKT